MQDCRQLLRLTLIGSRCKSADGEIVANIELGRRIEAHSQCQVLLVAHLALYQVQVQQQVLDRKE